MRLLATPALLVATAIVLPSVVSAADSPVGLGGYCPVCIVEGSKWMAGTAEFTSVYDGRTYQFPDAGTRDKFAGSPEKYVPALNGDCIVCYAKGGKRAPGTVDHAAAYKGRIYLFPGEAQKKEFLAKPASYVDTDLAAEGNCIVCKVKAGKDVPGKVEFTAIHDGFRYLFPSDRERQAFLASPKEFAKAPAPTVKTTAKPVTAAGMVSVEGRSACAACEFRVHPINDPDQLGLAVKADDGSIYVVEGAHKNYADIYKERFDLLRLNVTGKAIKKDGKVTWIEPKSVTRVN